jgi:hypothetical protein
MATPIQPTPMMKGEDAKKFLRKLVKELNEVLTPEELEIRQRKYDEMMKNYHKLVKATNGLFY